MNVKSAAFEAWWKSQSSGKCQSTKAWAKAAWDHQEWHIGELEATIKALEEQNVKLQKGEK